MNKLALAAFLLAAPLAARADIGLRLGAEANIASHYPSPVGTKVITDYWPLSGDVMLSYWTPGSLLSVDLELAEQFYLSTPTGGSSRIGTVFRPGVRLSPPVLPLYVRAALPINVESPNANSRETYDLRLGAGLTFPLVLFKIYIEADADFPLGGGTYPVAAKADWQLWLTGGLDFRF